MADSVLNHYKIDSLDPSVWPAEKDGEDSEDDGLLSPDQRPGRKISRSSYSVLERNSHRISVLGAERTKDGRENLVQKDEADPLGGQLSVMQTLKRQGIPVDTDAKQKNRFLLSSTTFAPSPLLSEVHRDYSTADLVQGLGFLTQSVEQKSASLKVLVESNFERFVRAKSTIDNVYKEMVNPGQEPEVPSKKPHSRHSSRQSMHFRKTSQNATTTPSDTPDKRKNALIKEQEYGLIPIKTPLVQSQRKVEEVWGPALGGRDREENLKGNANAADIQSGILDIALSVTDCIKRRDHEALVEEYVRARRFADDARNLVESSKRTGSTLSDSDMSQVMLTARMWADVEDEIESFKRDVWRRLAGTHFTKHAANDENRAEEHMELIGILLELGVEDNPIWVWLFSRYDYLKQKIVGTFERSKVEIEILRRKLSHLEKPSFGQLALHLKSATSDGRLQADSIIDSPKVLELWEHIYSCLNALLSMHGGILGEVIEFWETAQSFIDGKAQRTLPSGIEGGSRRHHRLSLDGIKTIRAGAHDLIEIIRDNVSSFFSDPPTDDLSMLLSPTTPAPTTPKSPKTPKSTTLPTFTDSRFKVDMNNLPPPSPRRGESWENYAFWPPNANSLSGVHYLGKVLLLVGTAAGNMAGLMPSEGRQNSADQFKLLVGGVRERCIQAVCSAWSMDCENCKVLEDWTRAPERADLTKLPSRLMNFQGFLLSNLQRMLYISEATKRPGAPDVVVPPSGKLVAMVRSQFIAGIYKALNGMRDNAESPAMVLGDDPDGLTAPARDPSTVKLTTVAVDSSNKNVRLLLTLSNIQALRNDIMPHLITMFQDNFNVTLDDEYSAVQKVLGDIDGQLFKAYVAPIVSMLDSMIRKGIASPEWAPKEPRPTDARSYVYDVLLDMVVVHTEVSTTAQPLTTTILKHLLEQISVSLIESFKQRKRYNLPSLMQATLDVEFLAQTLNNYTAEKATDIQSAIYVALDERTDNDARVSLQKELQEMRTILRKLRERTRTEL
jgi:exocyst complex component 2